VICCELARISAHLLGLGASSMDIGAVSVFLFTFTEREKIYNLCELLTGARFTTSYTRVGGQIRDLPEKFPDQLYAFLDSFPRALDEITSLLTRNPIFIDRTRNVGIISKEDAIAYGLTGPMLRGSGVEYDVRKARPYLDYEKYEFDIPVGSVGDCYDRYLVRIEEMRQSLRILRQAIDTIPGGPVNVVDGKSTLPVKEEVLQKMEQLIHHFIITTEGIDARPARSISVRKIPRASSASTSTASVGASPTASTSAPPRSSTLASSRSSCPATWSATSSRSWGRSTWSSANATARAC